MAVGNSPSDRSDGNRGNTVLCKYVFTYSRFTGQVTGDGRIKRTCRRARGFAKNRLRRFPYSRICNPVPGSLYTIGIPLPSIFMFLPRIKIILLVALLLLLKPFYG